MKHYLLVLLSLLFFNTTLAQDTDITVTGTFTPKDMSAAFITVLGNANLSGALGEAKVTDGKFSISLPADLPEGVYKLGFGMQQQPKFYLVHEGAKNYTLKFVNSNNVWRFTSKTGENHSYISTYWQQKDSLMLAIGSLYTFAQSYPHSNESVYKKATKTLTEKVEAFKTFETNAITNAPTLSKTLLQQNKVIFYDPQWNTATIENNYLKKLWTNIPVADTTFYTKPYIGEKLEASFKTLIEDKGKTEAEKYQAISKRLQWILDTLKTNPSHQKYYNLSLRYFANMKYPYVADIIDTYLDADQLITAQEAENLSYRRSQQDLINKLAPQIPAKDNTNVLDKIASAKKILVFVGGNSPYSFELLNQLKEDVDASKGAIKVVAVLLTDNKESISNFKNRFKTWEVVDLEMDTINKVANAYKLIYAPVIFTLDKDNILKKKLVPFERLLK